jgi:hypothetical protein
MDKINKSSFNEESISVQLHLQIIQNLIQRMAANSANCKIWCITIVSAILVLIADIDNPDITLLPIFPIIVFFCLDVYYLSLEKRFRLQYNNFITKLHESNLCSKDLYNISTGKRSFLIVYKSMISFSIWPFYLMLIVLVIVAKFLIFANPTC